MGKENTALRPLDAPTWPTDLTIPAKQTVEVSFLVPFKFEDYNTSAAELYGRPASEVANKSLEPSKALMDFVGNRLKHIDGLVFFDYAARYKLALPDPKDIPQPAKSKP